MHKSDQTPACGTPTAIMPVKPSGKNFMSEFTRSGYLEEETIEAQGGLRRASLRRYGAQVTPEIKKAHGVEQ